MNNNENKNTYYVKYGKLIVILLLILIALFIYDKKDEWEAKREYKKLIKETYQELNTKNK